MTQELPSPMQIQPFEMADFSGGLTDNFFDSGPNRYAKADNFFITVDRKLEERWGTVPYDPLNYILPGQPRRVDLLFTYINESRLGVNQGRDIFVFPEVYGGWGTGNYGWSRVVGPSGNEAIGAGQEYAQTVMSEYYHQLYFTNDSQPIPSRVYRDQNNSYQVRTVGLPRVQNPAPYNDQTLLTKCIINANALRSVMIQHFNDQGNTSTTWTLASPNTQHAFLDKWSLSYFAPVVFIMGTDPEFPGPNPPFAIAGPATDLPSLLFLVGALVGAYNHHAILDANWPARGFSNYHYQYLFPTAGQAFGSGGTTRFPGPIATLNENSAPSNIQQAATILDDVYQKFYWHMFGIYLHGGFFNTIATMKRYDYTVGGGAITKIGSTGFSIAANTYVLQAPTVTPESQDFCDYVNGLHAIYASHLGAGGGVQTVGNSPIPGVATWNGGNWGSIELAHIQPDQNDLCTLPLSTTLDQAFLKIFWLRNLHNLYHMADAKNIGTDTFTFTSTTGSPNISAVLNTSGPLQLTPGTYIFLPIINYFVGGAGFTEAALVVSSSLGNAVLDRNVVVGGVLQRGYYAVSSTLFPRYHLNWQNGVPFPTVPITTPTAEFLTTQASAVGVDMLTWMAYGQEFMYALFSHMTDANNHQIASKIDMYYANKFDPTITPGVTQWYTPTVASIAYAFTYFYTWTVDPNGIVYTDESNPSFTGSLQTIEPFYLGYVVPAPVQAQSFYTSTTIKEQRNIPISQIPIIVNDLSTNYDTENIQVKIYRTTSGGTTFYLDNTVSNGTTSYADIQNSTVAPPGQNLLQDNELLYTDGGAVGNDQPPQCKCLHIVSGTAYYGNIISFGQYLPNTLVQSLPNNPESAPATFTDTFDDEIVAISSNRGNVIVFCRNSIYRESGGFNNLGQGQLSHQKISDAIGCLSPLSVVRTEIGVFFAGNDGFYYTDGFQLIKVSIDLNNSYLEATQTQNQRDRISGAYDKTTRRIWWSMQKDPTGYDVDMNWIFYLDYGIKPSGVFTTASNRGDLVPAASTVGNSPSVGNPLNYNYWQPTSIVFQQGVFLRGDPRGLIFKSDPYATTDPKIDLTIPAYTFVGLVPTQNWNTIPVPFKYKSTVMDFGTHWKRKYATRINWTGKNVGNAQVQTVAISDNGRIVGNMAPINYIQNPLWGDPGVVWGTPTYNWYYKGSADFWRRFPVATLRANLRQVELTNAFLGIYRSEDFPSGNSASSNSVTKVVTLNTPAFPPGFYGTINWPLDVVDYFISFGDDGYVKVWQIAAVSTNTLTVLDSGGTLTNKVNVPWVIRGYKKNMAVEISALVIRFALFGDKTSYWQSRADSGENT